MIYVDTREKKSFAETDAWKNVEVQYITMKTADYTNSGGHIKIERKSISDLCNSVGKNKKRFWKELNRGFDYLIIEGDKSDIAVHLKKVSSRMTLQYIVHCLKEIHEDYDVEVIMAEDREYAAAIALHILNDYDISPN